MKFLKNWRKISVSIEVIEREKNGSMEFVYLPKSLNFDFSGNQLKIIPASPKFDPTKESQRSAVMYLAKLYPNCEISSSMTPEIQFIDPGSNLESITCNICGQTIEGETWQRAMDSAYQNSFADLSFQTTCCHEIIELNDLKYDMPAGFSKFVIMINEPEVKENEKTELLENLKLLFGQDFKLIWAHY